MKRLTTIVLLAMILLIPGMALAQDTLLPGVDIEFADSNNDGRVSPDEILAQCESAAGGNIQSMTPDALRTAYTTDSEQAEAILACAIKSGYIRLWMLPYYVSYIANFFISIAGVISLLFVILGGFWYMTGGLTDDKEKGKKTIMYALLGFVLTLLAWILVNVVQVQVSQ